MNSYMITDSVCIVTDKNDNPVCGGYNFITLKTASTQGYASMCW